MDLTKSLEYFNPTNIKGRVHIIGCGSVGSTIAEQLTRLGATKFVLYDFDKVEPHNIANQMFVNSDIGSLKVDAVKNRILSINPDIPEGDIKLVNTGWTGQKLSGYVFLAVDSVKLRREIAEKFKDNRCVTAMFDFRTGLEDAQHYAADWSNESSIHNFISSMDFTDDEADEATPKSACGGVLGVNPTVHCIVSYGVANFVNFINKKTLHSFVIVNPFSGQLTVY